MYFQLNLNTNTECVDSLTTGLTDNQSDRA